MNVCGWEGEYKVKRQFKGRMDRFAECPDTGCEGRELSEMTAGWTEGWCWRSREQPVIFDLLSLKVI